MTGSERTRLPGLDYLARFRYSFYDSLAARADALFDLTDAVLCADGPVTSLAELSLAAEHRRGHGALYDSVNEGRIDIALSKRDETRGWWMKPDPAGMPSSTTWPAGSLKFWRARLRRAGGSCWAART